MAANLPTTQPASPSSPKASGSRSRALLVAAEPSRSQGNLVALPATAPEWIGPHGEEQLALAAMDQPKKPAPKPAKPAPKPAKPAPKTPAKTPAKPKAAAPKPWQPPVLDMVVPVGGGGQASHSTKEPGDPDVAYAFNLFITGTKYGMFSEIGGLSWKAEPVPVRSGGNNEWVHSLRGPGKFEPLTLKRGWFASTGEFFNLLQLGLQGTKIPTGAAGRFTLTIECLDRGYQPIGYYDFVECFFVEYTGPGFNSMSGQVGFEQIRVAYDYFTYSPA